MMKQVIMSLNTISATPVDSGYRMLVSTHDSTNLPVCQATDHAVTISRRGFVCDGIASIYRNM